MVSTFQMQQPYYNRPGTLTVDTHTQPKFFDKEDDSVLDENLVDSGLEMSPALVDSRRESFAIGSSLFSPKQEDWSAVDMQSIPSNNPFLDQQSQSNNPFMQTEHHQQTLAHPFVPQQTWAPMAASTAATAAPVAAFDGLSVEFAPTQSAGFLRNPIPFTNPTNNVTMFSSLSNHNSHPTSPQKEHWSGNMGMNKKSRPDSPGLRSHNELRKGDGIRKKNARFEIPAERNLANIDQLIAQSTDEQEVKELKQQKRLLRNRQAALDSRQRKKQHTERLEDDKKHYTAHIASLEDQLEHMRMAMQQLLDERPQLINRIHGLELENEELVRRHTEETADLRRQVKCLTEHIQEQDGTETSTSSSLSSMSGMGVAPAYTTVFDGDMDGLNADNAWAGMGYMGDFHPSMDQTVIEVKQEPSPQMAVTKRQDVHVESEKPTTQGGILFMLFLVGALVCSSRSTVPTIPRVSEDVRVASETILKNVINDAGVSDPVSSSFGLGSLPHTSAAVSWPQPSAAPVAQATGLDGVAPSMLGDLSDFITRPTAEQAKEQMFSLTAAQYNAMLSDDFMQAGPGVQRTTSHGRRNLAEALASVSQSNKASEVYTRSLLWDQIPSDVVKTFVKMVAECNQSPCASSDVDD